MKHLLYIICFLSFGQLLAQNERYFDERYISSFSMLNPVLVNPGATGQNLDHRVFLTYKNNWASFEGTPKSFILSYDGPVANRLGFGAQLLTDKSGDLKTTKLQGSVSYTIQSTNNVIGFGIAPEFIQHGLSGDVFTDPTVSVIDPTINSRLAGTNFFDVSIGIHGKYNNKLSYGLALPSLVSTRIDDSDVSTEREIGYLFNLGYQFDKLDANMVLEPSIWVKKLMHVPFHADINVLAKFLDDKLRGGIIYTVGADEKLGFLIGTSFNAFNFNYSYGASRNEFQTYNNGSHELSVSFNLGSTFQNEDKTEEMMENK